MRLSIITALIMTFAHTMGSFGAVYMIGGSIPGKTRVASIALFEQVESMNYEKAHKTAVFLLIVSMTFLFLINFLNMFSKINNERNKKC
jgi:molybdate transport system permease protein